jgi:signal transduction histidine kinase
MGEEKLLSGVEDVGRLRELMEAVLSISSDLSLPDTLKRIVSSAVRVVNARYGALGVLSEDNGGLAEFVYVGLDRAQADAIGSHPQGRGILGLLIREPRPIRLPDLRAHPDSFGFPSEHPPMTSFLGVPIVTRGHVFGNLYLTDKQDAPEFSAEDEALVVALAGAAAVAIENARLHARVRDLALAEDRERIAADLHDTVIQRLFAVGLGLQAIRPLAPDRAVEARVQAAVDSLDETIRQIRSTIFALQGRQLSERGLRDEISRIVTESTTGLGFEPFLHLDGAIDSEVGEEMANDVTSVLREALSNVIRHANARRVDVEVLVRNHQLRVEVRDDGVGVPPVHIAGRGLTSMAQRSERRGGTMSVSPGAKGKGTILAWRVPLPARSSLVGHS